MNEIYILLFALVGSLIFGSVVFAVRAERVLVFLASWVCALAGLACTALFVAGLAGWMFRTMGW